MARYLIGILIGIDVLANAILFGRPYQTISCRVGESIAENGWAARVPWPRWWIDHCIGAVYSTVV